MNEKFKNLINPEAIELPPIEEGELNSNPEDAFESAPEKQEASAVETQAPRERKVVADKLIASILEQTLNEVDPGGEASIVMIEHLDDEKHTVVEEFDAALEIAAEGKPLLVTSFWPEAHHAKDPRWHAVMAYPNVKFVRLPFALSDIGKFLQDKTEERPFDKLAIRLLDISKDVQEIGILAHDLNYALRGEKGGMETWEGRAREVFGQEMTLEEIIERVSNNNSESVEQPLEGEEFPDLCFDIEGTLIQNGEINKDLLQKMIEESKTRPITIWTGGDIKQYEPILRKAGVKYKIASKHWFKGATVSESFDDEPKEEFERKYGANVKKYNQIG
jgi:hypothetical protein